MNIFLKRDLVGKRPKEPIIRKQVPDISVMEEKIQYGRHDY